MQASTLMDLERLEFDRIHRALTHCQAEGPPRDIIVKLHFFRTKEQILSAARHEDRLLFQGHTYQLFSDLAPLTIAKLCSMKPQLQILLQHQLKYTWGFPFALQFTHRGQQHSCTSPKALQCLLESLQLAAPAQIFETSLPQTPAHLATHPYSTTPNRTPPAPIFHSEGDSIMCICLQFQRSFSIHTWLSELHHTPLFN